MTWRDSLKKGGLVSDVFPLEFTQMQAEKAEKRLIPSLLVRFGLNIGRLSETASATLVAEWGKRPDVLMDNIKQGFDERGEWNKTRMDTIKRNIEERPRLLPKR